MNCTKAIIPVAGYGTRRLPITKAIEKCMLPLGNRPIVDYIVQDCIRAGVEDIYFVVNGDARQLREYYGVAFELTRYLEQNDKSDLIASITPPAGVNFHFIDQSHESRYGTTVPVWLCRDSIDPGEHVLIMMGDDVVYHANGTSEAAELIKVAGKNEGAMSAVEVPLETVGRYGVLVTDRDGNFKEIQEKPRPAEAKSQLINVSNYCVPWEFFKYIEENMSQPHEGEYMITEALQSFVDRGNVLRVRPTEGKYLDAGTVENWIAANDWLLANDAI